MYIKSLRVKNCLGFADSGDIRIEPPKKITYLLGRNSSGKTSFLRAIQFLEYPYQARQFSNFRNFNSASTSGEVIAQFVSNGTRLNIDGYIARVKNYLKKVKVPADALENNNRVREFIAEIRLLYANLFEEIAESPRIGVAKSEDGDYRFSVGGHGFADSEDRIDTVSGLINKYFGSGQLQHEKKQIPVSLNSQVFEDEVFALFPHISFFGYFAEKEIALSDRIQQGNLAEPSSKLESAFIKYIGEEHVSAFFLSEDPEERQNILGQLNRKASELINRVNATIGRLASTKKLLDISLDAIDGLQTTIYTDGKPSFFRHVSDNTQLLIAFHLFAADQELENNILLFDEPNTGFHPTAQKQVLRFLQDLSQNSNQVIVSTHSEHLIDVGQISGARLMATNMDKRVYIKNHPFRGSPKQKELLALQPVYDAIGLEQGLSVRLKGHAVIVEGITDLLYLKAFNELLGIVDELSLAPTKGDSHIVTIIPFFIAQGVGIKVVVDHGGAASELEERYLMTGDYIFEVAVPTKFEEKFRRSGIEDCFTKEDFERLLKVNSVDFHSKHFWNVPNSAYIKNRQEKSRLAYQAQDMIANKEIEFSDTTLSTFSNILKFCEKDDWFRM